MPAAAVGIAYGSHALPPGSLTARIATTKINPIRISVRLRAQYSGRKRQSHASMRPDSTTPINIQAAALPQFTPFPGTRSPAMPAVRAATMASIARTSLTASRRPNGPGLSRDSLTTRAPVTIRLPGLPAPALPAR